MEDLLTKAIKLYLGDHILERVLKYGEKSFELCSEEKEVTMLSSDILPFNSVDRKLTKNELIELLNEYLNSMCSVINKFGGIINNVIGNSIFSFWDTKDHAKNACNCVVKSLKISKHISDKWRQQGFPELITTFGINTGYVSLGNFGSTERLSYTIFGDQVNFTERLQTTNKTFGTRIIISEFTKSQVENEFGFEHIQKILIKGKKAPINLYTIN